MTNELQTVADNILKEPRLEDCGLPTGSVVHIYQANREEIIGYWTGEVLLKCYYLPSREPDATAESIPGCIDMFDPYGFGVFSWVKVWLPERKS